MIKAVILKDLTKYNPKLTKGLVGFLVEKECETFFLTIKFPEIGKFKIQSYDEKTGKPVETRKSAKLHHPQDRFSFSFPP